MKPEEAGIGCTSIAELELPVSTGKYFKPEEGSNKMRVLQGPVITYVSQQWGDDHKPVPGTEKIVYQANDEARKKDPHAKLTITYLIYNYTLQTTQIWEIGQISIIKAIKDLNDLRKDLSKFDIALVRKKSASKTEYSVSGGETEVFSNKAIIDEVLANGLTSRMAPVQEENDQMKSYGDVPKQDAEIEKQIQKEAAPAFDGTPASEM